MVYPFDIVTGSELTNSSMTENGFRLDLAKSRYLKINLKREVLKDSADGLVEDTRFNGPAKDGAEYTDEGIYTITVHNEYTGQLTTKRIYVGTNNVLRAHMTTGLSIPEINDLVAQGATISTDGTIQLASVVPPAEPTEDPPIEPENPDDSEPEDQTSNEQDVSLEEKPAESNPAVIIGCLAAVCIAIILFVVFTKRKKPLPQESAEPEGSADE